jgi:hypothetical protein
MVRNWFDLKKNNLGRDIGSSWKEYILGKPKDKRLVEVFITEFIWDRHFLKNENIHIRFRMDIKMRWFANGKVFFDDELIIEFPKDYPDRPPEFFIQKYVRHSASHNHHTLPDGRLCVLTEGKDWGKGDTIISAINVALNRIVEHNIDHGE